MVLFRYPLIRGILTGLGSAVVAVVLGLSPVGLALTDWFVDGCFIQRGTRSTTARVVIVSVDGSSLDALQKPAAYISPELARVIQYAHKQGAVAIGVDLFVPDSLWHLPEIAQEHGLGEAYFLGTAVEEVGRVVLPQYLDPATNQFRQPLRQWWAREQLFPDSPSALALVNITADGDQFIRRQRLLADTTSGRMAVPFFALALYATSKGAHFDSDPRDSVIRVGNAEIPLDVTGRMRINFVGPPGSFTRIPLLQVLEAEKTKQPLPDMAGAVVLIGTTGGNQDIHATPYANEIARLLSVQGGGLMDGVEVQGHIVATLCDGKFLTQPAMLATVPWALLFGTCAGVLFTRTNLTRGAAILTVYVALVPLGAYVFFCIPGWLLNPIPLVFTGLLVYAVTFARRWRELRRMLGVVKSEAVTRALEADPRRLDPGGELREVTALFADIRGFTTFSERCKNNPQRVMALLNAYFETIIPGIEAHGGTIVCFMGDGIMVLFGSPLSQPDHAVQAVRAAIAIVRRVRAAAVRWAELGFSGMRIGTGIHTGAAMVGAIGGRKRVDYTAIGDTINTASRVEGQTKPLATDILITAATFAALPPGDPLTGACREIADPVLVAGRKESLRLYRVECLDLPEPSERSSC